MKALILLPFIASVLSFFNSVSWFGLPTSDNGGAFVSEELQTVILCFAKQLPADLSSLSLELKIHGLVQRLNPFVTKGPTKFYPKVLNNETYTRLVSFYKGYYKKHERERQSSAFQRKNFTSYAPGEAVPYQSNNDQPTTAPVVPSQEPATVPLPQEPTQQQQPAGAFVGIHKRVFDFSLDGGSILDVNIQDITDGKCVTAGIIPGRLLQPRSDYQLEIKWPRFYGLFGSHDKKSPKFTIVRSPKTKEQQSWF